MVHEYWLQSVALCDWLNGKEQPHPLVQLQCHQAKLLLTWIPDSKKK
jgi:hypothetical protein